MTWFPRFIWAPPSPSSGRSRTRRCRDAPRPRDHPGGGRALPGRVKKRFGVFDHPRGEFLIGAKYPKPVWVKPDWAFLEEGEPVLRDLAARLAPTELGDYAMDLGEGYLIHGTLYERALGLSITHGCVRLGGRDLESVYKSVRVGTPVYIF